MTWSTQSSKERTKIISKLISHLSITCMVVLSSLYISVASSLPSTSYIKPVEVWLIFNLAFPVLVILSNILLQVHDDVLFRMNGFDPLSTVQGLENRETQRKV